MLSRKNTGKERDDRWVRVVSGRDGKHKGSGGVGCSLLLLIEYDG